MKKLIIAVAAVLICIVGFFSYKSYTDKKAESEQLAEMSNMIVELNAQKSKLQREADKIITKRDEELRYGNAVILFFDNMTENLYTDVYPLLAEYGHSATVVMKNSILPGDEGAISRQHFDELLNAGWDTAIGCDDSIDMDENNAPALLEDYLDKYLAKLDEAGIDRPIAFCFDKGSYKKEFEEILSERGFKIIRHFGETGETFASVIGGDFYYIGSGWYCAGPTALEAAVVSAYEKNMIYSVSTGKILEEVENDRVDCTSEKYRRMLGYINVYCRDMEIYTVTEMYEHKLEQLSTISGTIGEYNLQIEEYEKQLAEIQAQIDSIYQKLL